MKKLLSRLTFLLLIFSASAVYSQKNVSGTVTGGTMPLPGVNITIKNTTKGTQTDFDGNYVLNDIPSNGILVFSYIGYKTIEEPINSRTIIDISMMEDTEALDEIVLIGLGQTQNKKTVSSAIAKVSSTEIQELSVTRPEAALQGTMPGVFVAQNSGSPGSPLSVRIRGVSTPNNSNPLYLVDGFQVPNLQHLNSDDIASISVLKDAAAVAVYGARGGSGVVLVDTKKGKRNSDHINVSVQAYTGIQNVEDYSDLMNKDEYLFFYKSAIQYANTFGEQFRPAVFNTIGEVAASEAQLPNTDWHDQVFEKDVPITNVHATISDGGEDYTWGFSSGVFSQAGVVGGKDKSNFSRVNMRLTGEYDITSNLTITANADMVRMDRRQVLENQNNETQGIGIVTAANAVAPIYPAYASNGVIFNPSFGTGGLNAANTVMSNGVLLNSMNIYTSPLYSLVAADQNVNTSVYQFGTGAKWEVLENLTATATFSKFSSKATLKTFQPDLAGTPIDTEQYFFILNGNQLNENTWTNNIDNFDANVEYTFKNLEKHHIKVLGGTSYQRNKGTAEFLQGNNLDVNTFKEASLDRANSLSESDPALSTNGFVTRYNESKLFSLYGRALYDYDEKYLLTASLRADKSSRFGPNNQTGIFPSFSGGWVLSQENFMSNSNTINLLKLRASWGVNGVDNIREDEYNTVYNEENTITRLGNPDVQWEEITQTNIGIDLNAFNNKLGVTLDYYDKTTDGILIQLPPDLSTGAPGQTFINAGGVTNKGFEALVSYRSIANKPDGFAWNASFNIGFNDNTFNADPAIPPNTLTGGSLRQFATPVTNTLDGHAIASFYGYQVDYINNRGEMIFKDLDGDGVVNTIDDNGVSSADLGDRTILGNPYPDITYGLLIGATFKGFDLNANLYGASGHDIFDARYNSLVPYSNRSREYATYGLRPVLSGSPGSQGEVSDFYIKDGTFAKFKNMTLGYSFKMRSTSDIQKMRVYIQGQNLYTWSNYEGGDPEIGNASTNPNAVLDVGIDRGFYPQPRTFMIGFQFDY